MAYKQVLIQVFRWDTSQQGDSCSASTHSEQQQAVVGIALPVCACNLADRFVIGGAHTHGTHHSSRTLLSPKSVILTVPRLSNRMLAGLRS